MKVFLAGEGKTELGRYALSKEYAGGSDEVGVLEALVRRHCRDVEIVGAELWKSRGAQKKLPKLRVGSGMSGAETQTVRGLALLADEAGVQALVFARDRDGECERERDVVAGLAEARRENPSLHIVGGVAIEMIECWLLALRGDHHSQTCRDPKGELSKRHQVTSVAEMVDVVRGAKLELGSLPADAESLRDWLAQAKEVFGEPSPAEGAPSLFVLDAPRAAVPSLRVPWRRRCACRGAGAGVGAVAARSGACRPFRRSSGSETFFRNRRFPAAYSVA